MISLYVRRGDGSDPHEFWAFDAAAYVEFHGLCQPTTVVRPWNIGPADAERSQRQRYVDSTIANVLSQHYVLVDDGINGQYELAASVRGIATAKPKGDVAARCFQSWQDRNSIFSGLGATTDDALCYW